MSDYADKTKPKANLIEEARERFKLVCEVEEKQRLREVSDLKFQIPELQWDEQDRANRMGDGTTPGRPTIAVSKIDQPLQLVSNQFRAANLGVTIHPISEDADKENAEMRQGLYRQIERTSRAELARSWAFDRARAAGRGAYRIVPEYDPDAGKRFPNAQRLMIKRILHQENVYFDPAASEPDWSDGEWAFVCEWVPRGTFVRKYGKKAGVSDASNRLEWEGPEKSAPDWIRDKDVMVAEYWYKEHESETIKVPGAGKDGEPLTVDLDRVKVCCVKMCGWAEIEEIKWPGRYIPVIPAIGRELIPFDGERHWIGMIRNARGPQQVYNYAVSTCVEEVASQSKPHYILAEGQDEGHKKEWLEANTKWKPYLVYKPTTVGSNLAPPPTLAQKDRSGLALSMQLATQAERDIQATTAVHDPGLGAQPDSEKLSGRAILALQNQGDAGTSHFMENFKDVSMTYEAKVILDVLPIYYSEPGRVVRILRGDDDKAEAIMLGVPFVTDPQTGRPKPVQDPKAKGAKTFDLTKGAYDVSVTIGKSFQTALEAGQEFTAGILEKVPALSEYVLDLVFKFRDEPGAQEIAKRLAKVFELRHPELLEGADGAPAPAQLQAENMSLKQQLQQASMFIQQIQKALETEQAKQQATLEKARMDNETKLAIAEQNNQVKLMIEGVVGELQTRLAALEHAQMTQARHEEQAHDVAMAAAGGRTMSISRDRGQEQGQEQTDETSQGVGSDMSSGIPTEEGPTA
jgi:hypothetical protein